MFYYELFTPAKDNAFNIFVKLINRVPSYSWKTKTLDIFASVNGT